MAYKDEVGSLDRIASALESMGGGGGLPAPTPEDSGKYLGVDNSGDWELSTPSGGGAFVVEMSNGTLNTKAGEIFQAFKDEKLVYVHSSIETRSEAYFQIVSAIAETNQFVFVAAIEGFAIFTASGEDDYPVMGSQQGG